MEDTRDGHAARHRSLPARRRAAAAGTLSVQQGGPRARWRRGADAGSPASPATLSPGHVPGVAAVRAPARADTRPDGRLTASRQTADSAASAMSPPGTAALAPPLPRFPPAPCSVRGRQAVLACTKVSPFTARRRLVAPSGLVSRIGEVIVMTWRWRTIPRWVASVSAGVCPGRWPGRLAKWWVGRLDLPGHRPALMAPEPQVSAEMYLAGRTGTDD
jgi:hypothetical protein